ncbi:hypothetical protein SAMN05421854_108204 [Amycolatopsis rubida]|uniref:Uncharacterized protein n=1 Tax=Amycolatopsis rubida TaxID=112413 RepID=A0A1I5V3L8_9PSEU|nr:hypothetical protein SAMN05421854_108204 [Amycolatopsis rubida]
MVCDCFVHGSALAAPAIPTASSSGAAKPPVAASLSAYRHETGRQLAPYRPAPGRSGNRTSERSRRRRRRKPPGWPRSPVTVPAASQRPGITSTWLNKVSRAIRWLTSEPSSQSPSARTSNPFRPARSRGSGTVAAVVHRLADQCESLVRPLHPDLTREAFWLRTLRHVHNLTTAAAPSTRSTVGPAHQATAARVVRRALTGKLTGSSRSGKFEACPSPGEVACRARLGQA